MCNKIGMHVALFEVIPSSLTLSQTASRCSTFLKDPEHKHAHIFHSIPPLKYTVTQMHMHANEKKNAHVI